MPGTIAPSQSIHFRVADEFWRQGDECSELMRGQNIVRAGVHNRDLVLHHIRAKGAVSRPELSLLTRLTPPAVFKITKDLLQENWLFSEVIRDGSRGQPTSLLSINPDAAFSIGLNVDRDHITYLVLDFAGNVRETVHRDIRSPTPNDVKQIFAKCLLTSLAKPSARLQRLVGVGVSVPDDFAKNSNPWLKAQWRDVSFDTLFSQVTDLPVIRENDAAAAAIGEMVFGAGLEVNSFFYIYLSVGLGGGLVLNRQYVRGSHGRSGELGYLPQINPFRASKSARGRPIEDLISATGFLEALGAAGYSVGSLDQVDFNTDAVRSVVSAWSEMAAEVLYLPLLSTICIVDPTPFLSVAPYRPPSLNRWRSS